TRAARARRPSSVASWSIDSRTTGGCRFSSSAIASSRIAGGISAKVFKLETLRTEPVEQVRRGDDPARNVHAGGTQARADLGDAVSGSGPAAAGEPSDERREPRLGPGRVLPVRLPVDRAADGDEEAPRHARVFQGEGVERPEAVPTVRGMEHGPAVPDGDVGDLPSGEDPDCGLEDHMADPAPPRGAGGGGEA